MLDFLLRLFYNFFKGMLNETAKKLNEISAETEKVAKAKWPVFTRVYAGDAKAKLAAVLKALAPEGKVLFVCNRDTFSAEGKKLSDFVASLGCKSYAAVFKSGFHSVEDAGHALKAAEDARCVLVSDVELFGFAAYVAMIAKIPCVVAPSSFGYEDVVPSVTILKNGKGFDRVKVRVPRYVILDEKTVAECDVASAFASVIARLPDFTDYRIACAAKKYDADKRAYSLMKNAVSSAFGLFAFSVKERAEKILEYKLAAELANVASGGRLCDYSSVKNTSYLCYVKGAEKECVSPSIFRRVMGLYDLCCSGEYDDILEIPDYLARADYLSDLTGCGDKPFLQGLKAQCALYNENGQAVNKTKNSLKEEIRAQNAACEKAVRTFYALGGKDFADKKLIDSLIKFSGDLPDSFNGMTVVRECGISEYL